MLFELLHSLCQAMISRLHPVDSIHAAGRRFISFSAAIMCWSGIVTALPPQHLSSSECSCLQRCYPNFLLDAAACLPLNCILVAAGHSTYNVGQLVRWVTHMSLDSCCTNFVDPVLPALQAAQSCNDWQEGPWKPISVA